MGLLNWFETPRTVGDPYQFRVDTPDQIHSFIKDRWNTRPIYISHNSYPVWDGNEPYQIKVNKLFFDFDSKNKIENALLDVRKLSTWCTENNLSHYVAFSGGKGFHCYILLKPQIYLNGEFLKSATKAIHLHIQKLLSLRTLDSKCSDPRRMVRVWYTPYCTLNKENKPITNNLYCCPLSPDQVHTNSITEILTYASAPTLLNHIPDNPTVDLGEFLMKFQIDVQKTLRQNMDSHALTSSRIQYQPCEDEIIKELLPRPCIHRHIMYSQNPPHIVRFAAAVQLKSLGYDREWVFNFFQKRNYVDSFRKDVCAYQINHIYDKRPPYQHPTCATLIREGLCIGKECNRYMR